MNCQDLFSGKIRKLFKYIGRLKFFQACYALYMDYSNASKWPIRDKWLFWNIL